MKIERQRYRGVGTLGYGDVLSPGPMGGPPFREKVTLKEKVQPSEKLAKST